MNIQDFIKKHVVSLLAIGVSTTSVVVSAAIPGAPGTTGSQGSIGATGPVGDIGPIGPQGPTGEQGSSGIPGQTPFVGSNGNWWIGEVDTGVQAEAEDGIDGEDGSTPYIGSNGNWWINDVDSGITAASNGYADGTVPYYPFINTPSEDVFLATEKNQLSAGTLTQAAYLQLKISQGYTPISNATQLFSISTQNGKYILTNHIDISTLNSWTPIHFNGNPFKGSFDGAGYEIRNLSSDNLNLSTPLDQVGLFGRIEYATISNVTFKDVNLDLLGEGLAAEDADSIGSLAGGIGYSNLENIQLKDVRITGSELIGGIAGVVYQSKLLTARGISIDLEGNSYMGSLFGVFDQGMASDLELVGVTIGLTDSFFQYDPWRNSNRSVGGLVGELYFSSLFHVTLMSVSINNYLQGAMETLSSVGGLIGDSYHGRFKAVLVTGFILLIPTVEEYELEYVGGVTGVAYNSEYYDVENFVSITLVMGDVIEYMEFRSVGGVIGAATFVKLEHVFNYGDVEVQHPTNGIDFCIYADIENCLNRNPFEPEYPIEYFGGLIGYLYGSAYITYSANFASVSSLIEVGGLIGSSGGGGYFPFYLHHDIIVQQSFNAGEVFGAGFVGGIMGLTDELTNMIVANSYNTGNIFSLVVAGGILGLSSPAISSEVKLVNVYNAGEIIIAWGTAGGLIGAAAPMISDFGWFQNYDGIPYFGNIHIYSSFNVGEMTALDLENGQFEWVSVGSIVGLRLTQVRMYGVSFLQQIVEYEIYDWVTNNNQVEFLPTGVFSTSYPKGVGQGNQLDMAMIPIINDDYYFNEDTFIYRSAWNFSEIWQWSPNEFSLPTLKYLP